MANHHATVNGPVPFTAQEEIEWAAMQAQYIPDYTSAITKLLDDKAKTMGYDDIATAMTWVGDPNESFNAEAVTLRDWRSVVWSTHNDKLAEITAGGAKISIAQFIALMPTYPV